MSRFYGSVCSYYPALTVEDL